MFALTTGPVDAAAVEASVRAPGAGAVVVFHGTVRDRTDDRRVTHLVYEAYPEMALERMRAVAGDVAREFGLAGIACVHRIGRLEVGETAMVVAISSPHRKAALLAVEAFVARLKREVPIWKKEHFEGGAAWVGSESDREGRDPEGTGGGA